MTNLILPSILVATALFAGAFAFMPIDEAQAVHTTIQNSQLNAVNAAANNCQADGSAAATIASTDDFVVYWIADADGDAGTLTISDGASAAADIVINIADGEMQTGVQAFAGIGATSAVFTTDDANSGLCVSIMGQTGTVASIVIT